MPISGPVVHQQLMDAYANLQSDLESARSQIRQAGHQRDELSDDRSEALLRLAEHYLPELTRDAVAQTWSEVRSTLSRILLRREDHVRRVQEKLDALTSQRQQQDQRLVEFNRELDLALETQQQVLGEVEQRLQHDERFVQLTDRVALAEAALERAEANLEEIDQDSARKLPAYDNSTLFRYLYDRGFGTRDYTHRGLTRRIDRWLARYIDYNQAKQGYEFLRKTPEQMRQIIAEDRQAFDTVMDELERRRDDLAVQLELPEKIRMVKELQQRRGEQLTRLNRLLAEGEQIQSELNELENTRGPYYQEAVQVFREMLSATDTSDLDRRARATLEITDDQIVARLIGVESEVEKLDESARRRRSQLDQTHAFLEELGRLVQRFRAAEFDSSRSQFVGSLDVFEELERAQPSGDLRTVWKRIRNAQRWGPTTVEKVTEVATHPLSQVVINAMAYAAGQALGSLARRAGVRRARRDSSWQRRRGRDDWRW